MPILLSQHWPRKVLRGFDVKTTFRPDYHTAKTGVVANVHF